MDTEAYLDGYTSKVAKKGDPDLPGGEWYKSLLPGLTMHQAGRAQALNESMGRKGDFQTRHPYLTQAGAMAAGMGAGGAAGAALGGLADGEDGAFAGGTLGMTGGGLLAGYLALLRSQSKVKETSAIYKGTGGKKSNVMGSLEGTADKNMLWGALKGLITGPYDYGRTAQLQSELDGGKVKSGYAIGAGHLAGLAPVMNPAAGMLAIDEARDVTE